LVFLSAIEHRQSKVIVDVLLISKKKCRVYMKSLGKNFVIFSNSSFVCPKKTEFVKTTILGLWLTFIINLVSHKI